jgi:hypothetical protein
LAHALLDFSIQLFDEPAQLLYMIQHGFQYHLLMRSDQPIERTLQLVSL